VKRAKLLKKQKQVKQIRNNFAAIRPKKLALFPPCSLILKGSKTMFTEKQGLKK